MSYSYEVQKKQLFTEAGADTLLRVRDRAKHLWLDGKEAD